MHTAMMLSFQDELEKISGAMEDAHADYMGMMKKHMNNPQVVSRLHPTERMAVFKHLNSPKNAGLGGKIVAKAGKAVSTFSKAAGLGAGALDVAGLGALAAPTIQHMRGKPMSDKAKNRTELAGLGVLGASVAAEHAHDAVSAGKAGLSKLRGLVSKMPKHASATDTDEEYKERGHRALKGGMLAGGALGLRQGIMDSKNFTSPSKALGNIGFHALAGSGFGGLAGKASHEVVYGHRKPKKKTAAPTMGAMMSMHRLADAAKAAKPVASAAAGAGKALTNPNNMGRAAHLAANVAQGGHAWNPAAAAKRAISL